MDLNQGCEHCGAVLPLAQLQRVEVRGAFRLVCAGCLNELAEQGAVKSPA